MLSTRSVAADPKVRTSDYWITAAVFVLLAVAVITGIWVSGAFHLPLVGYPDESPHYVTTQAVRSYLLHALGDNPVRFMEQYYLFYPKVAIGHWPPVFYFTAALWMILFGHSIASLLVLNALCTAATGTLLFVCLRGLAGNIAAAGAALFWILLPANYSAYSRVLTDPLLSFLSLSSAAALAAYLSGGRRHWLPVYGIAAFLAVLTKGSGLALLTLPVLAALIAARRDWLLDWRLHVTTAATLLSLVPWHLFTWHMLPHGTLPGGFSFRNFAAQLWIMVSGLLIWLGPAVFALALMGAWLVLRSPGQGPLTRRHPFWACMFAIILSSLCLYVAVPMGMESRRTLMAAPGIAALAALAALHLTRRWRPAISLLLIIPAALSNLPLLSPAIKPEGPWRQFVLEEMIPRISPGSAVLVSGTVAEGVIISEYAQAKPQPDTYLLRASKHLVESDWLGMDYRLILPDVPSLEKFLKEVPVNWVVLETGFDGVFLRAPDSIHLQTVRAMLQRKDSGWVRVASRPSPPNARYPGVLELFRREKPIDAPVSFQTDMTRSAGFVFKTR